MSRHADRFAGRNADKHDTVVTQQIETSRQQRLPAANGKFDVQTRLCRSQPQTADSGRQWTQPPNRPDALS